MSPRTSFPLRMLAAAVGVFVIAGAFVPPATADPPLEDFVLGDFESPSEGWSVVPAAGGAGSYEIVTGDARAGDASAQVQVDLSNGGYVEFRRHLDEIDVLSFQFSVRTADVNELSVRLTDATGQSFQQRVTVAADSAWQDIVVADLDGGTFPEHWGGANDGVWRGPATEIAIIVNHWQIVAGTEATLDVDAVSAHLAPPALDLQLATLGNVFVTPAAPEVNFTGAAGSTVEYRVYDVGNNQVTTGAVTNTEGAGTIEIGALPEGYYRLQATQTIDGQPASSSATTLAVVGPHPDPASSPFAAAVSHRQLPAGSAPLAALAGDSYYRPSLDWTAMERTAGVYTFNASWQNQTIEARDAGLTPLPICAYTNPLYDNNATPHTDAGRDAFANYCAALVQGYADIGNPAPAVEVYNEFNARFGDLGDGPANSTPEYYYPLLQATYEAVKAANPETLVVGPAVSWPDLGWLETLFALGALEYMDVVSVHYPGDPPEAAIANLEAVDALVREYNDGQSKPIYVTEWGWSSRTGSVDEHTQASYAARSGIIGLSQGVERNFWYDFNNDGLDPADHESNFGLLRNAADPLGALTPKPSYASHATMSRLLTGTTFAGSREVAEGVTLYRFHEAGATTAALWSTAGARTVSITTPEPVTVVEMTGRSRILEPYGGRVELTVTGDPVYVIGQTGTYSVADGGRFTLTAASPSLAGDDIQLSLDVDKVGPATDLAITVNGITVPVQVRAGRAAAQIPITVPDTGLLGTRNLVGIITSNGTPVARLSADVEVLSTPVTVSAVHALREDADVLSVEVANEVATDQPVGDLTWQLGGSSGTETIGTVPAGQTVTLDVPTTGLAAPGTHPWSVELAMPDGEAIAASGRLVLVDPAAVSALHQQTITVDGVPDDLSGITPIDLDVDGEVRQIPDWGGAADLGGDVWWTWDDENLYLTAAITDNVHAQPGLNDTIWTGDSIQFSAVAGTPGEDLTGYYEYGLALTSQGPQVFRWNGGGGILPNGPVAAVDLAASRDEATQTTVYEMAMPWSELAPFDPADRLLALSFLVNENDGAIRRGWVEWGSGIGSGKNPALYQSTRLDPQ
ncbi:hypothetical protein Bcav_0914 [Beutenbergia cavernae DSM 12333]|uniref:Carbohydrate-binding domain-containing protein n=2 Tax=Beutenbergia TaxID=84756 RepID=C5BZK3_BEUC1|nr:hypothetical protein Bcav_0914 [Beutenbergia cavernae DSM 12333]